MEMIKSQYILEINKTIDKYFFLKIKKLCLSAWNYIVLIINFKLD